MTSPFKTFRLGGKHKKMPVKRTANYEIACKLRSSGRWQTLRECYIRDNPLCQDCAQMASQEVHHIMSVAEYPELCFERENLRALCVKCHEERHKKDRRK